MSYNNSNWFALKPKFFLPLFCATLCSSTKSIQSIPSSLSSFICLSLVSFLATFIFSHFYLIYLLKLSRRSFNRCRRWTLCSVRVNTLRVFLCRLNNHQSLENGLVVWSIFRAMVFTVLCKLSRNCKILYFNP